MRTLLLSVCLVAACAVARSGLAAPSLTLSAEAPTLHSPIARYSGADVVHRLPVSLGARADLGLPLRTGETRWLLASLGGRSAGVDLGRYEQAYLDLAYRGFVPSTPGRHPWWEAGMGVELMMLDDHDGEALGRHWGPRIVGGLGLEWGANRLRLATGARVSFTMANGDWELSDERVVGSDGEEVVAERFYTPAALCLSGTLGLRF